MSYFFSEAARVEHLEHDAYYEEQRHGLGARYLAAFDAAMVKVCANPASSLPPAFGFIEYWAFPTTCSIAKLATMLRFLLLRRIVGGRATGWVGSSESIHRTAWSASARATARSHTAPSAAASFNTSLRERTTC